MWFSESGKPCEKNTLTETCPQYNMGHITNQNEVTRLVTEIWQTKIIYLHSIKRIN